MGNNYTAHHNWESSNTISTVASRNNYSFTSFLIACIILLFHQSAVIGNINFSGADPLLLLVLILLFWQQKLFIPVKALVFFIAVVSTSILRTSFFQPFFHGLEVDLWFLVSGFLKLLAVFLYLIIGNSISKGQIYSNRQVSKVYTFGGIVVASLAVFLFLIPVFPMKYFVLWGRSRLKGFMNDPNYFSVLCVSCLPYVLNMPIGKIKKTIFVSTIIAAVLGSSSKTGMVVLISYWVIWIILEIYYSNTLNLKIFIYLFAFFVGGFVFLESLDNIINIFPTAERIKPLFENFLVAFAEGGSGRLEAYHAAIGVIKMNPIFGTGFGGYIPFVKKYFYTGVLSHNSYLQIAGEWGIPLALIFFSYLFFIIIDNLRIAKKENDPSRRVIVEIIVILLIGSLGIALNNARMFWFFLGVVIYHSEAQLSKIN